MWWLQVVFTVFVLIAVLALIRLNYLRNKYDAGRHLMLLAVAVMLSGCIVTTVTERPPFYTRYEIDAINAESACRNLARTIIQMERCTVRR